MRSFPTLLCDIPAEQRKPVCSTTAALISSTMRAPTVSCSSAELCSPNGGTGKVASHCWRPLDLCSSGDKRDDVRGTNPTRVFAVLLSFEHQLPVSSVETIS